MVSGVKDKKQKRLTGWFAAAAPAKRAKAEVPRTDEDRTSSGRASNPLVVKVSPPSAAVARPLGVLNREPNTGASRRKRPTTDSPSTRRASSVGRVRIDKGKAGAKAKGKGKGVATSEHPPSIESNAGIAVAALIHEPRATLRETSQTASEQVSEPDVRGVAASSMRSTSSDSGTSERPAPANYSAAGGSSTNLPSEPAPRAAEDTAAEPDPDASEMHSQVSVLSTPPDPTSSNTSVAGGDTVEEALAVRCKERLQMSIGRCQTVVTSHNSGGAKPSWSSLHIARHDPRPSLQQQGKSEARGKLVLVRISYAASSKSASHHHPLEENIQRVFTKFKAEGKATVRLRHPAQDILISKVSLVSPPPLLP